MSIEGEVRLLERVRALLVVLVLGVLALPDGDVRAQERRVRWGMVVTHAVSARNPVRGTGESAAAIGELYARMRPGSVEVQASLPLLARPRWSLEFAPGLIPLTWVGRSLVGEYDEPESRTSFGVGLTPFHLRAVVGSPGVAVEASFGGSVLRYRLRTPAASASKTNFQGFLTAGVRVRVSGVHLGAGYRRSHISNGGRAEFNPGIDSNDLYLALWFR